MYARHVLSLPQVNCETDFVARNGKFQSFVSLVANTCLQLGNSLNDHNKVTDNLLIYDAILDFIVFLQWIDFDNR